MFTKEMIQKRGTLSMSRYKSRSLTESVTYLYKVTSDAAGVSSTVSPVSVEQFENRELDALEAIGNYRRFRISVEAISFVPTRWDTITRSDSTVWQVLDIRGGPGTPFWILPCRQRN
jgi:hypothetical protein